MADEAENIGGIKVIVEVSDAGLDSQIRAIESRIQAAAERWQGLLSVHATATGPAVTGGAAPAAPPGPSLAEQARFIGGGSRGGAIGKEFTALDRAIADALAKEEAASGKIVSSVQQNTQKRRESVVQSVQATAPPPVTIPVEVAETPEIVAPQAPKPVTVPVEVAQTAEIAPPAPPAPVQITVDDTAARAQLTDFLAFVKTTMAEANEAAVVRPQIAAVPPVEPAAAPQPVTVPVETAEAPEVVAPTAPQAVEVPVEVAETPEVATPQAPAAIQVPVEVGDTPEVAAPVSPQAVEVPVTVAETPAVAPPQAPAPVEIPVTVAETPPVVPPPPPQAPPEPVEAPPIVMAQEPQNDPLSAFHIARRSLVENETDETIDAYDAAAKRLVEAQDQYVDAQNQPPPTPQAPPSPSPQEPEPRFYHQREMTPERLAQQEADLARNIRPTDVSGGANVPPFEPREDVNARRQQEGQAQLPSPQTDLERMEASVRATGRGENPATGETVTAADLEDVLRDLRQDIEPAQEVVPPKPGTLYSAPPDNAEADQQAREARQREAVFNRREQQASSAQRRQDARDLARAEDADRADLARQTRQRELQELSYENQQREQERPSESAASAPPLPPDEQARRQQQQGNQRNQAAGAPPESPEERAARLARIADFHRRQDEAGRADREEAARTMGGAGGAGGGGRPPTGGGAGRGRGGTPPESMAEFIERTNRRAEENIQRTLSSITAGGRTGQVAASGISAAKFGTRRQQIEASEESRAATAIFKEAQKRLRINPQDVEAGEALEKASDRVVAADAKLQNLQGFRATARNIGAIAVGAYAFSHAMSAVEPAIQAVVQAAGDWIDMQTGFVSKSTAVTSALSAQTHAQKGNVESVLAQSAATACLSKEASDYVTTQLQVTTQVKAGARAAQEASDLFRATMGLQQGAAPQGLYGGFGGLFGSSFLAQQMGGAKGFSETIFGDLTAIGKPKGADFADILSGGVNFLGNDEIRNQLLENNKAAGANPVITTGFDIAGAAGSVAGGAARTVNDVLGASNPFGGHFLDTEFSKRQQTQDEAAAAAQAPEIEKRTQKITDEYLKSLTDAVERGGGGGYKFTQTDDPAMRQRAAESAAGAHDAAGASAALKGFIVTLNGDTVSVQQHSEALQHAAIGMSRPDPAQLSSLALANERQRQREAAASVPALQEQFRYERPAVVAAANREQQFAQDVQIPAQAALQNLANPLPKVGTGIVAANANEQERIKKETKETVELQDKLNSYYDMGKQILLDTYQIPPALINSIQQVGQQIVNIQSNLRNEQAAFQVAQYNNQLRIARRSLADIGGLTGRNFGAGQSYLGVLEKQNLALSRQAQLMQFSMQQRQINFQVALAGFEAPGVTPEERQARVKEAEIEASFAQKQLNIQRQMFGNQVQIVDIQNLRQGVDLAAQISLLLQGRKLAIDTAVDEEKLLRLQKIQQEQLAQAGTYIEKVNKLTGRAFSEIQALETAAGEAMVNASQYALDNFGITLDKMEAEFRSRAGQAPLSTEPQALMPREGGMELKINTDYVQEKLAAVNEQQEKIVKNVGGYLGEVNKTVGQVSRQVNKLEGAVGSALGRATMEQVSALNTYFTAAAAMWSSFFGQVAQTAQPQGGEGQKDWGPQHASGFVGMTTGTTMTGAGVMGEAGQEAYAILKNPKQIMDFGMGGDGGNTYIIQFNNPVIREEQDMDKIAQKVMALTGREAALRGLRSVS